MDYLQYISFTSSWVISSLSFKPCYKWITFNTKMEEEFKKMEETVLNLVINGLPSILCGGIIMRDYLIFLGFKPCYKWITFNTFSA